MLDTLGPELVIKVWNPKVSLRAYVVIDNTTLGVAKGGIRMTPHVTEEEVFRLARGMTLKNALAELPFGGGKSGIVADPRSGNKEILIRAFARTLRHILGKIYVAGPDMGTNQNDMAIIVDELDDLNAVTGKPLELGGIPHDLGYTGYGVYISAKIVLKKLGLKIEDASFSIHGFGDVGSNFARFVYENNGNIVAVADSKGVIYCKEGIDVEELIKVKEEKGSVVYYENADETHRNPDKLISYEVDVLVPASKANLVTEENIDMVKAKVIVEGANIPLTIKAEEILWRKGVVILPDIIANAGGVIASYAEWINSTPKEAFKIVEEKIAKNAKLILNKTEELEENPRKIAEKIALERINKIREKRRF